jgi:hypothetical protein
MEAYGGCEGFISVFSIHDIKKYKLEVSQKWDRYRVIDLSRQTDVSTQHGSPKVQLLDRVLQHKRTGVQF